MGRGRGKRKKQTSVATRNDAENNEEEKLPASKRRGRPQKPLKDEIDEEGEVDKIEDDENPKSSIAIKDSKDSATTDNGKKRKRSSQAKENSDSVKENSCGPKSSNADSIKSVGFRPSGNRRKSKPHRAAEVGVECS